MKNAKLKTDGFTLIELLVVIAIISLLSSIVLASLGTARDKAKDASVKESMSSMRAEAELYSQNGIYPATLCTNNGELDKLLDAINPQLTYGTALCSLSPSRTNWLVYALLNTGGLYCVDSTSVSRLDMIPHGFQPINYTCENSCIDGTEPGCY